MTEVHHVEAHMKVQRIKKETKKILRYLYMMHPSVFPLYAYDYVYVTVRMYV